MTEPTPLRRRLHRLFQLAVAGYWLAMFAATHVPRVDMVERLPTTDKELHFSGYFVLGLLLPFWRLPVTAPTVRRMSRVWAVIALYGALDELLQIPVGRSAEVHDWVADAVGAAGGVLLAAVLMWVAARRKRSHGTSIPPRPGQ
jgi:VanZ family protein